MKFSAATVLSLATLATAAPSSTSEPVPFPPEHVQPQGISLEQAADLMANLTAKIGEAIGDALDNTLGDTLHNILAGPDDTTSTPATSSGSRVSSTSTDEGSVHIMAGCRRDIHMKWGTMTAQQRTNFVNAIKCLTTRPPKGIGMPNAKSLYDELAWVHATQNEAIHQSDIFLPWHRYYLHAFRTLLNEQCGFYGPYPWWKETNNAGNFPASDIFSSQWFGALPQADANGNGFCVTNGAFAGLMDRVSSPGQERCVARGEIKAETNLITRQYEDICNGQNGNTYPQHRECVELTNHARLHRGFGPTMANAAVSPADPVFFLHHSYIDWQWKRWQNADPSRWTTIQGCANRANPCAALTRDTVLSTRGLIRDMTVGEILDSEGQVLCMTYDELQ